jgi:hypothetical protein
MTLSLGAPVNRTLPLTFVDATHAYARLGEVELPAAQPQVMVSARVVGGRGEASLTLVNNLHFPELHGLARLSDGSTLTVSRTTDTGFLFPPGATAPRVLKLGDGPSAVATWEAPGAPARFVVAHRYSPELWVLSATGEARRLKVPDGAVGLTVDGARGVAYVAEDVGDTVFAVELTSGHLLWRTSVAPNPRELALAEDLLAVGSLQTGRIEVLDRGDGHFVGAVEPAPGVSIVGGHTEPYSAEVMGGKAVRGLAYSSRLKKLFVASIGPNVGPNRDRMEVSMNGGVGVVDLAALRFERHLGFDQGVPSALALDESRGILYVADIGVGLVRPVDAVALASSDTRARGAAFPPVKMPVPAGFPTVRPEADFGTQHLATVEVHRAGVEVHAGPAALALSEGGGVLQVVNRFTGTLARVDFTPDPLPGWQVTSSVPVVPTLEQPERRKGEVLYYADLGLSGMSCDSCHLDGHSEGILFAKTHPLRIYRSPSIRGARDTPPYFTPASTFSLAQTAEMVGGRNRYHNPDLTPGEIGALTLFTALISPEPNPFVGEDGAPREALALPNGAQGNARAGAASFAARCQSCHPPPVFSLDQDPVTRGQYLKVGTPGALPLREAQQEILDTGFGPPSLVGAWDVFPMLGSGAAGLEVATDGSVKLKNRSALQEVLEHYSGPLHGDAMALSPSARNDLWAYVMSL